jgi:hypothetical protein
MAKTVGIFGISGDGKTTSIVINPDGTYSPQDYKGMEPEKTLIINGDGKSLPFHREGFVVGKNHIITSDLEEIKRILIAANNSDKIQSIVIDTINSLMVDFEMLESKKLTFDKWADLAKGIYELIHFCNTKLRDNLVVYLLGHVSLYTDVDGNESKCLVTNGRKLEKIRLESKLPVVLFTYVEKGMQGENKHYFETQKNRSTGKTPLGMFDSFLIPNSLKLVDDTIRKYYNLKN